MNRSNKAPRGRKDGAPAPSAKILQPGGSYVPLATRGRGARFCATQINDFRVGIDKVLRDDDGRVWVVDGEGRYAPVQVWEPPVSELPPINPSLSEKHLRGLYEATRTTPYLSEEGREERLASIRSLLPSPFQVVG